MGLKAKRTSAYRPQTNGKAERFIKTLQNEWAYGMPFASSEERKRWLPRYLSIDNGRRCQMAIGSRTPVQQLERLRVTECPGEKTHLDAACGATDKKALAVLMQLKDHVWQSIEKAFADAFEGFVR